MANITYKVYRRYSKTEKPIPVATGLVTPTYEIPNIDYDRDVYLSVGRVVGELEVYGQEYKYFIPFETPTIEASYTDGVITVQWTDNPIYVDDLYLYTSSELITDDDLPPPIILNKGVTTATVNKILAADETVYIRLGSVRNNKIKLSNEVSVSVFEAPYDVVAEFKDGAINLRWKLDGFVDEQRYYCSETPIDLENLPVPKAILAGDALSYIDTDIAVGSTYYILLSAVRNNIEKISDEFSVKADVVDPFEQYLYLYASLNNDYNATGKILTPTGSSNSFQANGGVVGNGFYRAGGASYIDFDMTGFFSGKTPFCIEFYARSNGLGTDGVASFTATKGVDYAMATLTSESWFISRNNNDWSHLFLNTGAIRNTWNHHAFTYDGENLRRFLNGNLVGTTTETIGFTQSRNFGILGKKSNDLNHPAANDFQHLRLTKGVPRYTSTFTPPVEF